MNVFRCMLLQRVQKQIREKDSQKRKPSAPHFRQNFRISFTAFHMYTMRTEGSVDSGRGTRCRISADRPTEESNPLITTKKGKKL